VLPNELETLKENDPCSENGTADFIGLKTMPSEERLNEPVGR